MVANRRVLVRRDEPHGPAAALREKNRAAVQPERLAELARDRLEDVDEMQRGGDFFEDLDDGEEVLAFAFQFGDAGSETFRFRGRESGGDGHGIVCVRDGGGVKLPLRRARGSFGADARATSRLSRP
jgi:hypothetical protein